jgi:WhiB family redox-sensing transcriptional regulator
LLSDFRERAACRDVDPELFFPVGHSGPAQRQIAAAKAVCRRCPVIDDCLAWALDARHEEGVWGGQDMAERNALRRRTHNVGARPGA